MKSWKMAELRRKHCNSEQKKDGNKNAKRARLSTHWWNVKCRKLEVKTTFYGCKKICSDCIAVDGKHPEDNERKVNLKISRSFKLCLLSAFARQISFPAILTQQWLCLHTRMCRLMLCWAQNKTFHDIYDHLSPSLPPPHNNKINKRNFFFFESDKKKWSNKRLLAYIWDDCNSCVHIVGF